RPQRFCVPPPRFCPATAWLPSCNSAVYSAGSNRPSSSRTVTDDPVPGSHMSPSPPESSKGPSFEDALAELDKIVRALETGDITLEDALSRYEDGVGLLKRCYSQLRQAEQRILLLSGEDPDGKPLVQPFEPSPTVKPERPDAPRRSRPESAY